MADSISQNEESQLKSFDNDPKVKKEPPIRDPLRDASCDSYRRPKDIPIKIFKNKKMQRAENPEP